MKQALLLVICVATAIGQVPEELQKKLDFSAARIVRLRPSAFPQLPNAIVRELERRGCTIPQDAFTKKPANVVKGEFARSGQKDWAVLCSVNGVSNILVFWNGSEKNPAAIAAREDRNFLQGITETEIGFSRGIGVVGKEVILEHYRAYGGPKPPPIDHQGIDDAFLEKASEVWYFYQGKFVQLTGSD